MKIQKRIPRTILVEILTRFLRRILSRSQKECCAINAKQDSAGCAKADSEDPFNARDISRFGRATAGENGPEHILSYSPNQSPLHR